MNWKYFLLCGMCLPSMYAANILLNPGFETEAIGTTFKVLNAGDTTSLPNWTVTGSACASISNCVLVLRDDYTEPSSAGTISFQPHGGRQSLDVTGGGNTGDGAVQQTVTLTPGTLYTLSFWLGNMDNAVSNYRLTSSIQVFINGADQGVFSNASNSINQLNWAQRSFSFTAATASTTIEFRNATDATDNEAGLDDVVLDVAAPEPGTFGLLGLALGALGLAGRKRLTRR